MTVTIRDVARLAGVSVATVSRVINASAVVQSETRQRVLDAARELRFSPNSAARSLITQRTGAVGVILPDLYGEFYSELLRGMDQTAQRHGHHLLVSSSHHARSGLAAAIDAMRGRVDGLILMASDLDPAMVPALLPATLPTVLVNSADVGDPALGDIRTIDVRSITVDNYGGAYAMTTHLLRLGHARIGFVAGPDGNVEAAERQRGYVAALGDAGIPYDPTLCVPGEFFEESGERGARLLLGRRNPPTAIFAANDATAIGVLSALRDAALRAPADIAVVGFDDIPVAPYVTPPLTTVRVGIAALGERAMMLLLAPAVERAPPNPASRREVMSAELVIRASCGAMARPPSIPEASKPPRVATPDRRTRTNR